MATGHILPGYGQPVTRLRRAKSAFPLDKTKLKELVGRNVPPLEQRTLENIRANARNAWLSPDRQVTTYNSFHQWRNLDEPTQGRPTSPTRRHKPHPKPVFLTNRLHYIPGYHNPDATMGKDVYRIDDSVPEEERQLRRAQREKYIGRPRTAAIDQYREPYAPLTEAIEDPNEGWGAQAWLKVADDDYKHEVVNAMRDYRDKELVQIPKSPIPPAPEPSPRPQTAIPSMHRWMKMAGPRESEQVRKILYGGYPPSTIQPLNNLGDPPTLKLRKQQDLDRTLKTKYVHKSSRGEFLIHPEWPPSFPHHRID